MSKFIIFVTPQNRARMLTKAYNAWRSGCYYCELMANDICKPIRKIFATVLLLARIAEFYFRLLFECEVDNSTLQVLALNI